MIVAQRGAWLDLIDVARSSTGALAPERFCSLLPVGWYWVSFGSKLHIRTYRVV
jgi:hypothetical protein